MQTYHFEVDYREDTWGNTSIEIDIPDELFEKLKNEEVLYNESLPGEACGYEDFFVDQEYMFVDAATVELSEDFQQTPDGFEDIDGDILYKYYEASSLTSPEESYRGMIRLYHEL